jgi:voltage-gated potassium channel
MTALAIIFLIVLILPLASNLTSAESATLHALDLTIWAIFAVEYLTRFYLVTNRVTFFRTHILDFVVVAVPFLRPFRLLRVVAIVMSTSRRAGALVVQRVIIYVALMAAIVMTVCAVIVYHAERSAPGSNIRSLGASFWWALTTVTTVGYGDKFPITTTGRITAAVLMFTGIALVGCITAGVAAVFVNAVRGKPSSEQLAETHAQQHELNQHVGRMAETICALHLEITALRQHVEKNGAAQASSHSIPIEVAD